jgi:hypothetical protein
MVRSWCDLVHSWYGVNVTSWYGVDAIWHAAGVISQSVISVYEYRYTLYSVHCTVVIHLGDF